MADSRTSRGFIHPILQMDVEVGGRPENDLPVRGDAEDRRAGRWAPAVAGEKLLHRRIRPGEAVVLVGRLLLDRLAVDLDLRDLRDLGPKEVVRLRRALLRVGLHRVEKGVERRERRRVATRDRRLGEILLEIEELQLSGRAEDRRRLCRIVDSSELDDDVGGALARDVRRGDAELVDAVENDVLRGLHLRRVDRLAAVRDRPEDDLEAALQIEAQRRLLIRRRAGDGEERGADRGGQDDRHEDEVVAAFSHSRGRLAALFLARLGVA